MSLTPSVMTPLGSAAADFSLPDVRTGKTLSLADFSGKEALLIMFICRHCPYVRHVEEELARLGREYGNRGAGVLAISSNDAAAYPDDRPESLAVQAREAGFVFPYLYDETQAVARSYNAACTPDFFVYDKNRRLAYRGQLDDSRPGNNKPVTGADLRSALDAVLAGRSVSAAQRPSAGCNIKWKQV